MNIEMNIERERKEIEREIKRFRYKDTIHRENVEGEII